VYEEDWREISRHMRTSDTPLFMCLPG